jgi:hypothetical protein
MLPASLSDLSVGYEFDGIDLERPHVRVYSPELGKLVEIWAHAVSILSVK